MTINATMLVALGFLCAAFLAVLLAPAYRKRTVRLTTAALKRTLPLTEEEMRADKDRLRADHAIRVHNLEAKLEAVALGSARQKIEVNRRDARISELEVTSARQKAQIDELENARRVLEQTVMDRLPRIEARLGDAKKLLAQRDHEVSTLALTAQKQARALGEASQISLQQGAEIERLTAAMATRAARQSEGTGDQRYEAEMVLRAEIDALNAKSRDQSALIVRLQDLVAQSASRVEAESARRALEASIAQPLGSQTPMERLQSDVGAIRKTLNTDETGAATKPSIDQESEVARLKSENADMARRISALETALAQARARTTGRAPNESQIAAKAQAVSLEAATSEHATTVASLRAEIIALNDRLARQSAHFLEETKRLGAAVAKPEVRSTAPPAQRSLAERINDRAENGRIVQLTPLSEKKLALTGVDTLNGADVPAPAPDKDEAAIRSEAERASPLAVNATPSPYDESSPAMAARRPRLLDRITRIDKPGT